MNNVLKVVGGKIKNILLIVVFFVLGYCAINGLGIFVNNVHANTSEVTSSTMPKNGIQSKAINKDLESKREKYIAKTVGEILEEKHYRKHLLDNEFAMKIFDEYLKVLDSNKMFFTEGDIDALKLYKINFSKNLKSGNTDFAFASFDLLKKRANEYEVFAKEYLSKPIDFSIKEDFEFDREKAEYSKNLDELKDLWRKKIKNDVLTAKLYDRLILEDEKDKSNKSDSKTVNDKKAIEQKENAKIQKLWNKKTPNEKILTRIKDFENDLNQKSRIDILGMYLTAVANIYGPHTDYMSPRENEDFDIGMSLSLTGIGATLTSEDGFIRVVDIVAGGPAATDGRLKAEDRIIAVAQEDGEAVDVIDMSVSNAVKLIRGKENTKVKLTVIPGKQGRTGKPVVYELTRAVINLEDSAAKGKIKTIEQNGKTYNIGVITVPSFYMDFEAAVSGDPNYRSISKDVAKILKDFEANDKKVDGIVVDLRNNGGGSLYEAIELSGLFVKTAPIVQIRGRNGSLDIKNDMNDKMLYDGPMVILNNKLSASASEIFSGAMRDLNRAIIVGDSRSFGKGTVLEVLNLKDRFLFIPIKFETGSLRYETSLFYRITGSSVQQLGIESDIVIPSLVESLEIGEMFYKNHLPWDEIDPIEHELYVKDMDKDIEILKKNSEERIAKNEQFKVIARQAELIEKNRSKKKISLNGEERYKEYQDEKKVSEATEKLMLNDKNEKSKDVTLEEALNITADFSDLLKKK